MAGQGGQIKAASSGARFPLPTRLAGWVAAISLRMV